MEWVRHVVRFVVSALVIWMISFLVPQFNVGGFWPAVGLALVIALVGWGAEAAFGRRINPFGRGVVGFIVSALVIYVAQFVVVNFTTTMLGALLAALVIGVIDLFMPIGSPFKAGNVNRGKA